VQIQADEQIVLQIYCRLFPISESGMNSDAQPLTENEAKVWFLTS